MNHDLSRVFMRRISPLLCAAALLTACASTPALPADEVLRNAMGASRELKSASFTAEVHVSSVDEVAPSSVKASLDGRMQDGGRQIAFALDIDGTMPSGGELRRILASADIVVLGQNETYARLRSLSSDPPDPSYETLASSGLIDAWWKLPSTGTGTASPSADPKLLQLQTNALRVTREHGIESHRDGKAYHYDVTLDEERLMAFLEESALQRGEQPRTEEWRAMTRDMSFAGEAWIDAETFHLMDVTWAIRPKTEGAGTQIDVAIALTKHNESEPISPPADAQPLPTDLQMLLPIAEPQLQTPATPDALSPEAEEEILRQLLENQ